MDRPLKVNLNELKSLAKTVTHEGEQLEHNLNEVDDQLSPEKAPKGWATTEALANASQAWTDALRSLSSRITKAGSNLSTAATNYRDTDERSAARHRRVGGAR
ncbi:MAG TPA: type VII secretion target [Micromonospora sp.]